MVNFSVFNELSLPLDEHTAEKKFRVFFELLKGLSNKGLNQIRMSENFKNYQILSGITFQQFLGQQQDKEFRTRLKGFINFNIVKIDTPIIQGNEETQIDTQQGSEYFYNNTITGGGLTCCDIWNTIAVSFDSDAQWRNDNIDITKNILNKDSSITKDVVQIKHASEVSHLESHTVFFNELQAEINLDITKENLWIQQTVFFPNIIIFCPEIENQIKNLNKEVFDRAMSILRDIETKRKNIKYYNWSPEGKRVGQNPKLKKRRMFDVDGQKTFIENHIKSLPRNCRIYFLEKSNKIYIGYIGKHLPLT